MRSAGLGATHGLGDVEEEDRNASGSESHRSRVARGNKARDNQPDNGAPDDERRRQAAVIHEQTPRLAREGEKGSHDAPPGWADANCPRAIRTAPTPAARSTAASPTIARSCPGQRKPNPSPSQNIPNAEIR